MKQIVESKEVSPIDGKKSQEILEYFRRYNFTDDLGHKLENCQDFIDLVRLVPQRG